MTQPQLRDLVKASNPVVTHALLPDERDVRTLYAEAMQRAGNPPTSVDLLDQRIERRRDMQTQERPIEIVREKKALRARRPLIPALAGAMAVMVIAVGVWALTRDTESEVADLSPIEMMELFNDKAATADFSGASDFYTPDATFLFTFPDGQSPEIPFFDEVPETRGVPDWDGDGTVNELDGFHGAGVEIYIGGTTKLLSCTQPGATTVVCEEVREGFVFNSPDYQATWTISFADGLIDGILIEVGPGDSMDVSAIRSYTGWVRANYPELAGDLVNEFSGEWKLSPETIGQHRQLVAEWQAQREAAAPSGAGVSPLEVMELFDGTVAAADWAANSELYAADATYKFVSTDGETPEILFSQEVPANADVLDWNADGQLTELDGFTWFGAEIYAGGVTDFLSCTQIDAATAVCEEVRDGYAFKNPGHAATWTVTVTDGLISSFVIELEGTGVDNVAAIQYQGWVEENRPELAGDLFEGFNRKLTPDTIATHRQLVAEWVAER